MRPYQKKPLEGIELAAEHGVPEEAAAKIPLCGCGEFPAERSSSFELRHQLLERPPADRAKRLRSLPQVRPFLRDLPHQRLVHAVPGASLRRIGSLVHETLHPAEHVPLGDDDVLEILGHRPAAGGWPASQLL